MKKTLSLLLALCMLLALGTAALAADTYTVTFSTGETYDLPAGEDLVFFFQCDAPGDMGAPDPEKTADLPDDEKGAGIEVSEGEVSYSHVGVGGPFSYPTSELVTVTGITGDITVTVAEAATFMDATHTIYFDKDEIEDAIAFAEEMAAQMAANPMSGEPSGEGSGEASGPATSGDYDVELDGKTVTAHFEETGSGEDGVKLFEITIDGTVYPGSIDKGVWTADNEADAPVIDAVRAAYEAANPMAGQPSGEPSAAPAA